MSNIQKKRRGGVKGDKCTEEGLKMTNVQKSGVKGN